MLNFFTFEHTLKSLPLGIILVDIEKKIRFWNLWMETYSEISEEDVLGLGLFDVFPELTVGRLSMSIDTALDNAQSSFVSHTINKQMFPLFEDASDDHPRPIYQNIHVIPASDEKENPYAVIVVQDISSSVLKENLLKERAKEEHELNKKLLNEVEDRKKAEESLKLSAAVINNTMEGVVITDAKAIILSVNPAFTTITGYKAEEVLHKKIKILKSGKHDKEFYANLWDTLLSTGQWRGEFINRKPDGELFTVEASITCIEDNEGATKSYVNVFRDITQRKKDEEQLKKLSRTDSLTQLANRRVFDETFDQEWRRARRHAYLLGLVIIDVDFFKNYNDYYGHQAGDKCLQQIAEVLKSNIKRADDLVARYGGEEFVLILTQNNKEGIEFLVETIHKEIFNLRIPHKKSAISSFVTISSGISYVIPTSEHTAEMLIETADRALYEAKEGGRDRIVIKALD